MKIDNDYLESLVKRLSGFKSPTDTQKLILELAKLGDARSSDDNRVLATLIRAEKQSDKLAQARAEARTVLDAKKRAEKRADNQRKIIWGATLRQGAKTDALLLSAVQKLWADGYISDDDKKLLQADYTAIINAQKDDSELLPPEPDFDD